MRATIGARYCGPPQSGNGGYSCGVLAQHLSGAVEVSLRLPPPLDVDLAIEVDGKTARMLHGDRVVAEARAVTFANPSPPPCPDFDGAVVAATHYAGFHAHDYPTCFACGPDRGEHDGLRIFSGATETGVFAAPWVPDATLADAQMQMPVPVLWAAIDCAGYWACVGRASPRPVMLLGRMTAQFDGSVGVGERCVVSGWALGVEGRKHFAGTALFGADGRCVGQSRQVWIELRQAP